MNKKGIIPIVLTIAVILGIITISGFTATLAIVKGIKSIPPFVIIGIVIVLTFTILRRLFK